MSHRCIFFVFILFLSKFSRSQSIDGFFDLKDYELLTKGSNDGVPFVKIFGNSRDTCWQMKESYYDSSYTIILSRKYFYNSIAHGPFVTFSKGEVYRKGFYNYGNYNGERLTYRDGILEQRAFFENGIKVGEWLEYDIKGKIKRRLIYNSRGELIEEVVY